MAITEFGRQLTELHRRGQLRIRAETLAEFLAVWPAFNLDDIDGSWPAVAAAITAIVEQQRQESAETAADYYNNFRRVEGLPDRFEAEPVADLDRQALLGTLYLLGPIGAKKQIARRRPNVAAETTTRVAGSVTRHVLNGGRDTLMQAVERDPRAEGWQRVTDSDPCRFCREIAEAGVQTGRDFQAHDHCGCSTEPALQDPKTIRPADPDGAPAPLPDEVVVEKLSRWEVWAESVGWDTTVAGRRVTGSKPDGSRAVWELTDRGVFRVVTLDRPRRR